MFDPNATLQSLHDALDAWKWQEAIEHAENLIAWLNKGGYVPHPLLSARGGPIAHVYNLRQEAMRGTLRD